jgi:glycosyltransferase involved in cell wall biosynthesis
MSENGHETPLEVTLVIPCYNHAHYLKECLVSLREQTYAHWAAIVVDDYSSDYRAIAPILEELGDERIRVVRHERNRGLGASRNTGIRESDSPLVLPLDADDKLDPRALELLVPEFEKDSGIDCVYPDVMMFGRQEGLLVFPGPAPGKPVTHPEHTIPGAGTMMRRALWERMGGYDEAEALRHGREDFEFWIRAFSQGCRSKRVAHPLYLYRHAHTSMNVACKLQDHVVNQYIHDKHRTVFKDSEEARHFLSNGYWSASAASYDRGQQLRALRLASKAFQIDPTREALRRVARAAIPPSLNERLESGELRPRLPFVGYPLRGEDRHRPFFIIGVARSGNTLFRRTLTAHSALHVPPETFVLGQCIAKYRKYRRKLSWSDLVHVVLGEFEFHHEYHTIDLWLGPLANKLRDAPRRRRNLANILNGFYRYHAERSGEPEATRWGDKTPLNSLYRSTLEGLAEVFPDAQFIHIYRDPVDVIYSHIAGGFMRTAEEASQRWRKMMRNVKGFMAAHPGMCHEVSYETLVSEPEPTLRGVCEFMEIDFEPQMISSEKNADQLGDVPAWFWHENVTRPINQKSVGKGRSFFSNADRQVIRSIAGADMARLGYPALEDAEDGLGG